LAICITARQLNPKIRIVTRITDIGNTSKTQRAGADGISPNYIDGIRMTSEMVRPAVAAFSKERVNMTDKKVTHYLRMEEIHVTENFEGKSIEELSTHGCNATIFLGIKIQRGWLYNRKKDRK